MKIYNVDFSKWSLENAIAVAEEFNRIMGRTKKTLTVDSVIVSGTREELIAALESLDDGYYGKVEVERVNL